MRLQFGDHQAGTIDPNTAASDLHDCLIVGGGVVGLSLAYELARRGLQVRLVDAGRLGAEASWAGAGILPPGPVEAARSSDEFLCGWSSALHRSWSAELRERTGIDNEYWPCGGLYVARDDLLALYMDGVAGECAATRVACEQVAPEAVGELEPALQAIAESGALKRAYFLPGEAQVRNPRHLAALAAACRLLNVEITEVCRVEGIDAAGGRVRSALTNRGPMGAETIVIAAGAWSGGLLGLFGLSVATRPVHGQMVLLRTQDMAPKCVVNEGKRYLVPRRDGRVLVGATEDDFGFTKRNTAAGVGGLLALASGLVPVLASAEVERSWAGLRPGTPDGRPILGRLPGFDNALVATGHLRAGLQLSTGTAVAMADLITGAEPAIDLATFSVERF